MRIRRVRLLNVQRHESLDLALPEGVTVIRGPNEAGKSTVQRALELALFKRCTATGRDVDALKPWRAPPGAVPCVELEFDYDGTRGHLVKRFAGSRGTVELELGDERITDPTRADQRLAELTGLPSDKFFRSTASVHHHEMDELDRDEAALRDRLQASISGADRGTSAAKRRLEEAVRRYTTEGHKNPGHLKRVRQEIAALEAELAQGEAALARLAEDRGALSRARDRRSRADAQLATDRQQLAETERAVVLLAEKEEANARYQRFKRAAELLAEVAEKEGGHPSPTPLPVLRNAVARLRAFEQKISELRAELAEEADVSRYGVMAPAPRWKPWAVAGIGLALAAMAAGGAYLNVGLIVAPLVLGLALGAVLTTFIALRQRRKGAEIQRRNALQDEQISRRLRGRSELAQELTNNERARSEELERLGLDDLPAAEALLAAETEHVSSIDRLKAELKGLVGEAPLEGDPAVMRDQAAAEAEQKTHALAGMGEIGADPAGARDRSRKAVAAAQAEREQAVAEEAHALARVEQNPVDAEQVATVAERLADARERLRLHERRLRIYAGALEALVAAEQGTMKRAARYLEERMGVDVARITGGRYRRVAVDENELRFRVWSPEREDWVDVRELSQGTLDQFYLAARLGLVRQVTHDRRPPLIFDDPFLTFDDERASEALELLKQIARDHQVLYLTTSERYDSVADHVVQLPAPTERDAPTTAGDQASPDLSAAVGAAENVR